MEATISQCFIKTVERHAHRCALLTRDRKNWIEWTWQDYYDIAEKASLGLHEMGIQPGDRVGIFSRSRLEWAVADTAILGLGGVTVPIYQSDTAEDLAYIINDAQIKVLFCEDLKLLSRFHEVAAQCPTIKGVICFERLRDNRHEQPVHYHWSELLDVGESSLMAQSGFFKEQCQLRSPDQEATIIYTSGTTGVPKGVLLTHEQITSEVSELFPALHINYQDRSLSFLPYAHVMGRVELWGQAYIGYSMAFSQSMDSIRNELTEVKPTVLVAVPRLFEKIHSGIMAQLQLKKYKLKLFNWALDAGRSVKTSSLYNRPPDLLDGLRYQMAKRVVFDSVYQKLGGKLRFAISGGAPLNRDIAEFFHTMGVLLLEGYGLTETTAAIAINTPFDYKFGTVGRPLPEVKIRLDDDGEILVKSKKVMVGYLNNNQANDEVFTDGWFHTGDIGEVTPDGFLRITDRKKELIKTAGGKYVAPLRLEGFLRKSPYISNVFIYGDRKKYVVALVTLNQEAVRAYAKTQSIGEPELKYLARNPRIKELIREAIAEANANLASFETIKNFAILERDFTLEDGELTPSLKIKRKIVSERYGDVLESLY